MWGSFVGRRAERWLPADELRRRRFVAMARGAASGLTNKALSVIVALVSVPLTIGYLGLERYGAWVAIGTVLIWMGLTDFGLGTGLGNALTAEVHRDRPDLVRVHLSNFTLLVAGVMLVVATAAALLWPRIEWSSLLGVTHRGTAVELRAALAVALAVVLLRMPLSMAAKVYLAYQEGHVGNRWAAAGSVLSLAGLLAVTHTRGGLPLLVLSTYGTGAAVEAASVVWLFTHHRPELRPHWRLIRPAAFSQVTVVSAQFFLILVMALVTFQTDTLVIAHFLGVGAVPGYSLPYQLFNYAVLPQTLIFPYIWTAFTEAITRRDIAWVRRTFHLYVAGAAGAAGAIALVMLAGARPFIGWWTRGAVMPSWPLIGMMAAWAVISAYVGAVSCLLAAASHLRHQLIYSAVATVANLWLSIVLVQRIGLIGVIGATVATYAVVVCGPTWIDAAALLRRLDREAAFGRRPA